MKIEDCISILNASYLILHIFASWPADAELEWTQDLKESKGSGVNENSIDVINPDPHPLATLHLYNFIKNSYSLAESWLNNDLALAVVVSIEDQYENEV